MDLPPLDDIALVVGGALAAGLVNGLTGTGYALAALGFWLHAMSPLTACVRIRPSMPVVSPSLHAFDETGGCKWGIISFSFTLDQHSSTGGCYKARNRR